MSSVWAVIITEPLDIEARLIPCVWHETAEAYVVREARELESVYREDEEEYESAITTIEQAVDYLRDGGYEVDIRRMYSDAFDPTKIVRVVG